MKLDNRFVLYSLPIAAIIAIAVIQSHLGSVAPAPPVAIPDQRTRIISPTPAIDEPTVLAPSDDNALPPSTDLEQQRDDLSPLGKPIPLTTDDRSSLQDFESLHKTAQSVPNSLN